MTSNSNGIQEIYRITYYEKKEARFKEKAYWELNIILKVLRCLARECLRFQLVAFKAVSWCCAL